MMSSPTLPSATDSEDVQNPDAPVAQAAPKRKALAEAKTVSRTSSRTTRSSRSTTSSTPTTTPTLPQTTRPQPNARLQVYVDPSPEEASSPAANEEENASPWTELGTRKSHRATAARRTPKIDVYRDPSPDAARDEPPADDGATPEPEDASPPPPQTDAADVSRVAAPDAPAQSSSRSKPAKTSPVPVLRDDAPAPAPAPRPAKGKPKPALVVFRDDPTADAENAPAPRPAKGAPRGKSRPAVFRDDPAPAPAKIPVFREFTRKRPRLPQDMGAPAPGI
ncbi:hypothetical protein PsYK624_107980 [Phanerochaete sordida]|uniref:Uncharacterized protein n=1 Tax=Phanerochaete sordida TaxID=48140 RepID=A0A9P3GFA8_9APHY|nr:hypothetical protein PsYK624_107980 [Phanerochaete sordida]